MDSLEIRNLLSVPLEERADRSLSVKLSDVEVLLVQMYEEDEMECVPRNMRTYPFRLSWDVFQTTKNGKPTPIRMAYITPWRSMKVLDTDSSQETEGSARITQSPLASSIQSKTLAIVFSTGL